MREDLLVQFIFFMGIILPTLYLNRNTLKNENRIKILLIGGVSLVLITAIGYKELFFLIFEMEIIIFLVFKDILNSKVLLTLNTSLVILIAFRILEFFIIKAENKIAISIQVTIITIIFTIMIWNLKRLMFKERMMGIGMLLFIIVSLMFENYILSGMILFGGLSICLIILNLEFRKEIEKQRIRIEALNKYTKNLEELNKDVRKFKHDYINILGSMNEFFNREDFSALKEFFEKNIMPLGEVELTKELRLGLLGKIKVYELKSILVNKIMKAYSNKIKVLIDIADVIENIPIDKVVLNRIIGALLDNAIEATSETKEKEILIGIFKKDEGVNIIIENFFVDKGLYLHEMMREGVSSKGEDRGLGLSNINEILSKNSNIILDTRIDRNKFIQHMIIY